MRYGILVGLLLLGLFAAPAASAVPVVDEATDGDEYVTGACYNSLWGESACCVVYSPEHDGAVKNTATSCYAFAKAVLSTPGGPPR